MNDMCPSYGLFYRDTARNFLTFATQCKNHGNPASDTERRRIKACFDIAINTGLYLCYYEHPVTSFYEDDEYRTMQQIFNEVFFK